MEAATSTAPAGAASMSGDDEGLKPEDPDAGKLFDLPRIKADNANPTVLKTAFSGGIEIERELRVTPMRLLPDKQWIEFFNALEPGKSKRIIVTVFCAGGGDVDAVVQTKSLVITDIHDPSDEA